MEETSKVTEIPDKEETSTATDKDHKEIGKQRKRGNCHQRQIQNHATIARRKAIRPRPASNERVITTYRSHRM
jgi:hypothetical protein